MKVNKRLRAELVLLSLTIAWGSTFALTKYLFNSIPVFHYLLYRFFLATLFFGIISWTKVKNLTSGSIRAGSILGILLFIGFITQTFGLTFTTASKSAFITGLMVIFAPLFQFILQKRMPSSATGVGVVIVVIGLYLLTSPQTEGINFGDLLTLLCAVTFGLYIVLLDSCSKRYSPVHLTFMQFFITSLLTLPFTFIEPPPKELKLDDVLVLLYLTLVPTILALFLQANYQKDTTPSRSAIIFSLEPVIATCFAFVILGEAPTTSGVIGGILTIVGVLVSQLFDREQYRN